MAKKDDELSSRKPPLQQQPTQNKHRAFISSVASKIAAQPFHSSDPLLWGILTPISANARKSPQGMNMLLTYDNHCIGRGVKETLFQIVDPVITSLHCNIYRDKLSVFLKDSSTNGTYVNWVKLRKGCPDMKLRHGDIISLAYVPEHERAFTYVFREIQTSSSVLDSGGLLKRKAEELGVENKKLKQTCIDASDGLISLDDIQSLQKSNTELRKLLEEYVATVASLHRETSAVTEKHEAEMQEPKESVSKSYLDQLTELNQSLVDKDKELAELYSVSSKQKHLIMYFSKRLTASMPSCIEANEIINSQKASISELKTLLNEERDQRREEREKASADLKMSVQVVQAEAAVKVKRVVDDALKREKGQEEIINKLQEAEKERSCLVETLKTELEDTRQNYNIVCKLEAQLREEHLAFGRNRKRIEELEHDRKRLSEQLECEKAAREEAWAKVSDLKLEISVVKRELDSERLRLKAARERNMICKTQLRALYSTTEDIPVLLSKQEEQLKSMQMTLEDEENHKNASVGMGPNLHNANLNQSNIKNKDGTVTKGFVLSETARGLGDTTETEHLEMESQGQGGNVNLNVKMLTDDELIAKEVLENLIHSFPE